MTTVASHYLSKYGNGTPRIKCPMLPGTELIVTIPCFNEPDLNASLLSLSANDDPGCPVEIIVIVNATFDVPEEIKRQNELSVKSALGLKKLLPAWLTLHVLDETNLPKKHAGVGLARKIAMDEASWRFENVREEKGIVICFDADSSCDNNYLHSIRTHFAENRKSPGCSIRYEHPLRGFEYEPTLYDGISQYELHLRYYTMQQKWLELPYAFQTVGSSMAVRWEAYQLEGGMNRRKAGEDFYFLHKIIARGNFTELITTSVIPSPRPSDRVPFGTGRAVQEFLNDEGIELTTYNPASFDDLKVFLNLELCEQMITGSLPESISSYLDSVNWAEAREEIVANSTSPESYSKRFFRWFNAFRLMKYLHYSRDNFHPNLPVKEAANVVLLARGIKTKKEVNSEKLVQAFRELEYGMIMPVDSAIL
jgi:glycosyltransferase involved in cell wall biosynthesis